MRRLFHITQLTSTPPPSPPGAAPDDNPVDGPYPTVVRQSSGRTVLVVQAYQYGKYLGQLNVTFDDAGEVVRWSGEPLVLDGEKDREAERRLMRYKEQVRGIDVGRGIGVESLVE